MTRTHARAHALTHSRSRLRAAALLAAPVLAFAVACGGGDGGGTKKADAIAEVPEETAPKTGPQAGQAAKKPEGKGAFYDAQVKYVQCMRTKGGAKDFPDPKLSGHLDQGKIAVVVEEVGDTAIYKGGKDGVCFPEMSKAMELEPPRDKQKDYESMLAHAKCMRDNGVSKFTNPTMSGGNVMPGGDPNPASPELDHDSPAYKQARETCKDKLLDGLDGMQ
ncbi:hypothetical protein [Streptomyces sp. NPDC050504]|uniref:hypothetical protein n=1 Tax=Streptomyces sp. NPDC050504 TaxID=3365618 RepID=UPI0037A2705B